MSPYDLPLGVEYHDGIAAAAILIAVPATDIPAYKKLIHEPHHQSKSNRWATSAAAKSDIY